MKNKKIKQLAAGVTEHFFAKAFASWFWAGALMLLLHPGVPELDFIGSAGLIPFLVLLVSLYICLSVLQVRMRDKCVSEWMLMISSLVFACLLLMRVNSLYVYIPLAVFFFLAARHYSETHNPVGKDFSGKLALVMICLGAVFCCHVTLLISILRVETYSAPNYDFGIFCNMYYNMKHGFLPVTTCERDTLLSHFAVHISPALYIFLPIYLIFPSPITIAVCQVLAIYSGIVPFLLIAKKYGVSRQHLTALGILFAASPVLAGGCLFDFHENCLLVPLLLWMFYFYEKEKTPFVVLFAVLTLMVKEDAFVYVAVFAVYLFIAKKKYRLGSALLGMACVWFIAACFLLKNYGTGIMSGRYSVMIQSGDGLLGIVKTLLLNPGYSIRQILTESGDTTAKLFYCLELFMPLAFLPFLAKKMSRLLLVLPVFLNLLTDYGYQYNIFFQYSFGIVTFLLYLSLINTVDMPKRRANFTAGLAAGLALMMFCMLILPEYAMYRKRYQENKETYALMDEALAAIPEEKSVCTTAFLLPQLSERKEIYEAYYHEGYDTDYLILDIRPGYREESLQIAAEYAENGYTLIKTVENCLMIYAAEGEE